MPERPVHVGYWPPNPAGSAMIAAAAAPDFLASPFGRVCLWLCDRPTGLTRWRGVTRCRICGILNGSKCFHRDGLAWPQGFKHYIEAHGLKPDQVFIDAALVAISLHPDEPPADLASLPDVDHDPPDLDGPRPDPLAALSTDMADSLRDAEDARVMAEFLAQPG